MIASFWVARYCDRVKNTEIDDGFFKSAFTKRYKTVCLRPGRAYRVQSILWSDSVGHIGSLGHLTPNEFVRQRQDDRTVEGAPLQLQPVS